MDTVLRQAAMALALTNTYVGKFVGIGFGTLGSFLHPQDIGLGGWRRSQRLGLSCAVLGLSYWAAEVLGDLGWFLLLCALRHVTLDGHVW